MRNDRHNDIVLHYSTITSYIQHELDSKGFKAARTIANKDRLLSGLISEARVFLNKPDLTIAQLMQPENIKNLKDVMVKMFSYSCGNKENVAPMARPTSLIRLHQTLDQLVMILIIDAIREGDYEKQKNVESIPKMLNFYLLPLAQNSGRFLKSSGLPQDLPDEETIDKLKKTYRQDFVHP